MSNPAPSHAGLYRSLNIFTVSLSKFGLELDIVMTVDGILLLLPVPAVKGWGARHNVSLEHPLRELGLSFCLCLLCLHFCLEGLGVYRTSCLLLVEDFIMVYGWLVYIIV